MTKEQIMAYLKEHGNDGVKKVYMSHGANWYWSCTKPAIVMQCRFLFFSGFLFGRDWSRGDTFGHREIFQYINLDKK
ncbi:hypothetical protein [Paenibacillus apiarius]|uniref:Uncharacterized protein n=1 Tax=Paenibacillus apiarius TaxID=46240 RepID=A0ABT4DWG5_9BACL|nr:hypothetical protein [Paenibacillus apiarius]MCY9513057.1 hypothetical protein [Paenibacillus apiarius]MCY9521585.1 hypothetical protein [Paenibacillus apiarius]MCY9551739.1 hypothetical protein [Paenibacillus apiarius]MCY9560473.1 hypothetical protein [Paenibacillus apiarius]MCY9685277.1 hypothetical protein [Paenibacillus apiarius]